MASSSSDIIIQVPGNGNSDYKLQLQQAIRRNDWNNLRELLHKFPAAQTEPITDAGETVLILVAKEGKKSNVILKTLIRIMPNEALTRRDHRGNTALHAAALVGNVFGAILLVSKYPDLANISNDSGYLPFHIAVNQTHRDLVLFLLNVTTDNVEPNPFAGQLGAKLICSLIYSEFYDVALLLIQRYPTSAWDPDYSPLKAIAQEPTAFPSGVKLGFWKRMIYTRFLRVKKNSPTPNLMQLNKQDLVFGFLRVKKNSPTPNLMQLNKQDLVFGFLRVKKNSPTPNLMQLNKQDLVFGFLRVKKNSPTPNLMQLNKQDLVFVCRRFFSKVLDVIVPQLKNIRRTKVLHLQAMELLRGLCREISSELIFSRSFLLAAQYGISEVVEEILKSFPSVINSLDADERSALHLAVMFRHENVFNVINCLSGESFGFLSTPVDCRGNNILHLAGYREQQYQLDLVSSAVLQMQRELKWFQEVERLVLPEHKKQRNKEGMTPLEVFQKEHKDMEVYERQWMIGMANSCTVATTIIGTIAFAAAITVPGGNKDDVGTPIFSGRTAFIIFAISNAFALFSSICTLLIFLSILTSRYATIDYLYSLPNRLIMGLVALFFSITSMIISFSTTLYLVFVQNNNRILIPIVALAILPVTLFVMLQFPLLLNMMQSTYGRSILRPPKKEDERVIIQKLIRFYLSE